LKPVITARHAGVTESMKQYALEKVEKLRKYFDRAVSARVTLDTVHDAHVVEMVFDVTRGTSLVGKAEAPDMFAACDLAEQKLAAQLRRFKQRLTDHRRGGPSAAGEPAGRDRAGPASAGGPDASRPATDDAITYEDVIDQMRRGE
jgi:putative sigma-54 modulation protein